MHHNHKNRHMPVSDLHLPAGVMPATALAKLAALQGG
jgi:hypothetical protein